MNWKNRIYALNLSHEALRPPVPLGPAGSTQHRLAEAFACLEKIERKSAYGQVFGKFLEQRIIWRELLELELQEIDEQIERISAAAGDGSG